MPDADLLAEEPNLPGRSAWSLAEDVTYLNHGSFGPSPRVVQAARERWTAELEWQPMDFLFRRLEPALDSAREMVAKFVGAHADELVFVDNATYAMNLVAVQSALSTGDEVLLTDHEYGAVTRIWRDTCREAGAELVVARLPCPLTSPADIVEALWEQVSERTRMIVVSHVTSPTAVVLPVEAICQRARAAGIPVCIDGPHALAMRPLDLHALGCDFYAVSCHKWLSAPFGSGFLYVARRHVQRMRPLVRSWGGSLSGRPPSWQDEFNWIGTRDPAAFLAVPDAVKFLQDVGLDKFRQRTHALAAFARERISQLTGLSGFTPDSVDWYGSMVAVPLPPSKEPPSGKWQRDPLQAALWEHERIEVPIVQWRDERFVRVSCHLYNTTTDIDRLVDALAKWLPQYSTTS